MKNLVLLKFEATWCQPCKQLSKLLGESFTEDFEIQVFDSDENPEVFKEFNVRSVPTLIITKDGEEVSRKIGSMQKDELAEFLAII